MGIASSRNIHFQIFVTFSHAGTSISVFKTDENKCGKTYVEKL